MKRILATAALCMAAAATPAGPAEAKRCPANSVPVGKICVDKYEASVWEIPPSNLTLIKEVQEGKIDSAADLAGATQRGRAETTTRRPARTRVTAARMTTRCRSRA
jgi:hypothetical protein